MGKITTAFSAAIKKSAFVLLAGLTFGISSAFAQAGAKDATQQKSVTMMAGPIWSKHFDNTGNDYKRQHFFAMARWGKEGGGSWGAFFLGPNSLGHSSFGAVYALRPYTVRMGDRLRAEALLGGGFVTGYNGWLATPLLVSQNSLVYRQSKTSEWVLGNMMMPYPAFQARLEKGLRGGKEVTLKRYHLHSAGFVVTTPTLGFRHRF